MSDVITVAEPVPAAPPAARELPFEFHGTGGEYFRIWIVNLLLTIVTLGIYSAWAKVRRLRYFYGSTSLAGSSFEYHGQPIAILKGRLIVVGFYGLFVALSYLNQLIQLAFIPLVLFGLPWVVVRSRLFQMRMTSWRGLRFDFHGSYGGAFGAYIGWMLLAILTLGVLWPMALHRQVSFLVDKTAYGAQRFTFFSRVGTFYRFCLATLAMFVGGIVVVVIGMAIIGGTTAAVFAQDGDAPPAVVVAMGVLSAIVFGSIALLAGAYYRSRFLNASIGGVHIGQHRLISQLSAGSLAAILLTNLLGMVFTLGLFYPWAQVRLVRYQLANTRVHAEGDIDRFVAASQRDTSALGEEAGDFFDVDFGI